MFTILCPTFTWFRVSTKNLSVI